MLRGMVFWSLLPFVSVQALRVRRNAPRLAPASGPSSGRVGSGAAFRLLAIGDSIIAGVGASSLDKALVGRAAEALAGALGRAVEWHAVGRSGIDSGGVLGELMGELPAAPVDAFLVSVGVNDVTSLRRSSTWERNLSALLQALADHSPGAVIAFAGMPPLHGFPLLPQPLRALIGFRGETLDRISR
ncbi:MAG TPA: SGNH/GDSL hydrolase family protein, partial [Dokdonella sp.]|nr:SGNH/GDSL hydrolase family protein [Dokdonella sp.]